jgi:hypothetical protein
MKFDDDGARTQVWTPPASWREAAPSAAASTPVVSVRPKLRLALSVTAATLAIAVAIWSFASPAAKRPVDKVAQAPRSPQATPAAEQAPSPANPTRVTAGAKPSDPNAPNAAPQPAALAAPPAAAAARAAHLLSLGERNQARLLYQELAQTSPVYARAAHCLTQELARQVKP